MDNPEKTPEPRRGKWLPRDRGGSIEFKEGTGGITDACSCGEFLEVYKEDVTFHLRTPETIDPERTNPNAPFVATIVDTVGSSNPVVARVLLQGKEILESALLHKEINKDAVTKTLHATKESLLVCHKVAQRIASHVDRISEEIRNSGVRGTGIALNPFPQVPEFDSDVTLFLTKAKRTVREICRLPSFFLQIEPKDSNFDALLKTITRTGCAAYLTKFIQDSAAGVRAIVDLRNYQEHPTDQKRTIVENFKVTPDGAIAPPQWNLSWEPPGSVRDEMLEIVDFLIQVSESMLIHLVMGSLDGGIPFVIQKINDPDPKKPIKYRLSVDMTRVRIVQQT